MAALYYAGRGIVTGANGLQNLRYYSMALRRRHMLTLILGVAIGLVYYLFLIKDQIL